MWIDYITHLDPGVKAVAVMRVGFGAEPVSDHFAAEPDRGLLAQPVMPGSLVIEGMAQTAGLLVGAARDYNEKVVLAKITRAELHADAQPGHTLRYTAEVQRIDDAGASTKGTVEILCPPGNDNTQTATNIGRIDLLFSHADNNMAGRGFPEKNFVFTDDFRTLLRVSGQPAGF